MCVCVCACVCVCVYIWKRDGVCACVCVFMCPRACIMIDTLCFIIQSAFT